MSNSSKSIDPGSENAASSWLPESLAGGVRFSCTECGDCCTGAPGKVRVTDEEISAISEFRKQSESDFRRSEIRVLHGEMLLKERKNGDCAFYENNRCQIHPVKPSQCRSYPFWFKNVRSEESWARTCKACPGIGQGRFYAAVEIVQQIQEELDG